MMTTKETRKTLAEKIYTIKAMNGEINAISMKKWVKGILNSPKYIPTELEDLKSWYKRELAKINF